MQANQTGALDRDSTVAELTRRGFSKREALQLCADQERYARGIAGDSTAMIQIHRCTHRHTIPAKDCTCHTIDLMIPWKGTKRTGTSCARCGKGISPGDLVISWISPVRGQVFAHAEHVQGRSVCTVTVY